MGEPVRVEQVMRRNLVTVHCQQSVAEAEELLIGNGISGLPIVSHDGHVMGVVSKTDVARFHRRGGDAAQTLVFEIGTPEAITVPETSSIGDAARLMVERSVHRVIVVRGTRPVGILSSLDFARMVAEREGA